jgi:pyrroline-5-carboxylate reductase
VYNRLESQKIAFAGAGSMAEAFIRGLTAKGIARPEHLFASNKSSVTRLIELREQYGIRAENEPEAAAEAIRAADIVVIAMKPKDVAQALSDLRPFLRPEQLLISVVAGLSIAKIEKLIGNDMPVVRTMPNTSTSIGLGAAGISFSPRVNDDQRAMALQMFEAAGIAIVVQEELIGIVNGVSGSGPAYIYYMMEAMIEAGVRGGLTAEQARLLTVQTVLGAASMVQSTGEDPAELRRKVTSPNGTTQAAIETLERFHFTEAVLTAIDRCVERAEELGAMIGTEETHSKQGKR